MQYLISFIKYLIRTLDFLLFTILLLLISLLPYRLIKGFFPKLYQWWSYIFFRWFGVDEHYHPKNTKPLPKQYILISNHYAGIDVVWVPGRFYAKPLSKDALRTWPVIGNIIRAAGILFVKRDSNNSRHAALLSMKQALQEGKNILVFPEGGCFGRFLHPFKDGAFIVSLETNIPILPIYLHYEDEDVYEIRDNEGIQYIIDILFKPRNRHAHMYVFDAFQPSQFGSVEEYKTQVHQFYKELEQKYKK